MALAPGEQMALDFSLSHRMRLPLPGAYRVFAWFRVADRVVRTNAVTILVAAAEPLRSDLADSHGGPSTMWFESWVAGEDAPMLFVRAARVGARFRQLQCLRACRLSGVVKPIISVAPNGLASTDRSVGWLHGGSFHVVDVGLERVTRELRSIALPEGDALVVGPLWKDPETDETRALIWNQLDRRASALFAVHVEARGIAIDQAVKVPLPSPAWIRAFHDSTGGRQALFLTDDTSGLSLFRARCDNDVRVVERPLEFWPWRLLAINAQMNREDIIQGVVAGRMIDGGASAPTIFCRWTLDRAGHFSAGPPQPWSAVDQEALDHLQMTVDVTGQPIALVHSVLGGWSCVGERVHHQVAPPLGLVTSLPPTLRLAPDGVTPMVVWHDANRGLIPVPVGVEVPDFIGDDFVQPPLGSEAS
jgi:hypothetical protein